MPAKFNTAKKYLFTYPLFSTLGSKAVSHETVFYFMKYYVPGSNTGMKHLLRRTLVRPEVY